MRYQFSIDRGGTFTDCILLDRQTGQQHITKVLSGPGSPLRGMRKLLQLAEHEAIPACDVRLGTTLATNALLERKGARTGLLITRGFRDLLEIGTQTRGDLFSVDIKKPEQLYADVQEVGARIGPDGRVVERPAPDEVHRLLQAFLDSGIRSVAIVVLHAYANGELESQLADSARRFDFDAVVTSTEAAREIGLLARAQTTVLDAYLLPLLQAYAEELRQALPGCRVQMMQSSGGLSTPELLRGPASLLSGPAGGVIAACHLVRDLAAERVITFDMGGTSTDVALVGQAPERRFESEIAGVHLLAPMIDIHTVAAGGGSICRFDGETLTVGPQSAGATPGPLIYGNQAACELTVSDVNFLLGRLPSDHFPFPLNGDRAREAVELVRQQLLTAGFVKSFDEVLLGFCEVANTHMAEAMTKVTIRRGEDPRDTTLVAFGGAGGQHACDIARKLGICRIAIHRLSGVFSAWGIGIADTLASAERDAGSAPLTAATEEFFRAALVELEGEARQRLGPEMDDARVQVHGFAHLRYQGSQAGLVVPWASALAMRQAFEEAHRHRFSFTKPESEVELALLRVEARIPGPAGLPPLPGAPSPELPSPTSAFEPRWCVDSDGQRKEVPVVEFSALGAATRLDGPALVLCPTGTLFVPGDFSAQLRGDVLELERLDRPRHHATPPATPTDRSSAQPPVDPVLLEVMGARLSAIAEQMGEALQTTAVSTNIRDRLDFSCAVFDAQGTLIANAPHIPVHLGAMGESVRSVLRLHPRMAPGESYVTNDPALGGSHLPDITVVCPVFSAGALSPSYFVASRGHHADIGGISPGSMPADSRTLDDEGIVLSALPLVRNGQFLEGELRTRLLSGPHPARNPGENLADLKAQVAATALGARLLLRLEADHSADIVRAYMQHLVDLAERRTQKAIGRLPPGRSLYRDHLDDGSPLAVELRVRPATAEGGPSLIVDFTGSAPESNTNLNAPRAVTVAAVLYFLRTLVGEELPLNDGCLRPVTIITEAPSLLDPSPQRAVAAGNVETSMRICDVLFAAAGLCAASQGTMNNVSFGTASFGYYETLAGGAGAGPHFDGASTVHSHMTNTRITDVEILEARYPVIVHEFSRRRDSGGPGRHRGGDGLVRSYEFTSPVQLTLLTERRVVAPFGLFGGAAGKVGQNLIDGVPAPSRLTLHLNRGQTLRIETPGGGGYGRRGADDAD